MKSILHICAGWDEWNGAANVARLLMAEQEREGHRVSCASWASVRQLRSADEVWVHCGWLPCLWWAAVWGRNVHWTPAGSYDPIRLRYHGLKKRLVGPIERFCLRRAKTIVATCEAERMWIQSYIGKRCPPVEVSDIRRFFKFPTSQPEPFAKDRPVHLLYMGRRHPLKGLEFLEEAVNDASNVELRIVSHAFGAEKEAVWKWCDVFVLPTLSDNFGLVVAEALERSKRVITTDGAPAWGDGNTYGGRLVYLKGYRNGTNAGRRQLLGNALHALPISMSIHIPLPISTSKNS